MSEGTEETDFHPLENEWVLWEHAGGASKDSKKWRENMKELCSFDSIETFWQYFNHIPRPSEVFFDGDSRKRVGPEGKTVEAYSLFKRGIEPEWKDSKNVTGGEWFCRQHFQGDVLDLCWQNLVLAVVGEIIEDDHGMVESHVNGARVVDKEGRGGCPVFRLELWLNTRNPQTKERIRQKMVDVMTDGQPPSKKVHPKFDWKDHSL